jgi:hypothetical protein
MDSIHTILPCFCKTHFHVCLDLPRGLFCESYPTHKRSIFWNITPRSPMKVNRRFGGSYRLNFQGRIVSQARTVFVFLISPKRDTCTANLILLDLIILIYVGQNQKLLKSSLCNFIQPPVTSFLLDQNILLSSPFSKILSLFQSKV